MPYDDKMQFPEQNEGGGARPDVPEDLTHIDRSGIDSAQSASPATPPQAPPYAQRPTEDSGWQGGSAGARGNSTYPPPNQSYRQDPPYIEPQYRQQPPAPQFPETVQHQAESNRYQWNFDQYEYAEKAGKKKRRRNGRVLLGVICVVFGIAVFSAAGYGVYSLLNNPADANPSSAAGSGTSDTLQQPPADFSGITLQDKPNVEPEVLPEGRLTTEQIVEKVQPSIVSITVYANTAYGYQAVGTASGIIIRDDGYIVTNAHVVTSGEGISVQLFGDEENGYEGRVVGVDTKTDLAVLRIDATGLPAATFGNSDQIKVGEKVVAIGTPQSTDFSGSVTQGIVSGLNRTIETGGTSYSKLIQMDAAINPGNSGGALVNEFGQVIGINSVKVVSNGQTYTEGMGFAIPAATVKPVVDDLIAYGRVTGRVRLGVTVSVVDSGLARLNGIPPGLLVQSTEDGSDISKQGVLPSDIITAINGKEIYSSKDLMDELEGKKPGDTVELEIYRRSTRTGDTGRFFTIKVKLIEDTGTSTATAPVQQQTPQPGSTGSGDSLEDFLRDFWS